MARSVSSIIVVRHSAMDVVFAESVVAVGAHREHLMIIRAPACLTGATIKLEPYEDMNVRD